MKKLPKISRTFLLYILGILALLYLLFLVGRGVYQNWQTNQELKELGVEIEALEVEDQNLQNLIAYYQTQSFKEKEARKKLGLVKPDEKVVIISKEPPKTSTPSEVIPEEPKKPNYQLWWEFLFKGK